MPTTRLPAPSTRRAPSRVAALLLWGALLSGCGGADRPGGSSPGSGATITTTPLRQVWVAAGPAPGWPDVPQRTPEQARERALQALARLRAGEDFAKVAAELSDDPSSKLGGGFVGFVGRHLGHREDLLREVAKLPEGGLSEPVVTEHGVHVLQRLSREEGRALEAKYALPIWGFVVQWHGLVSSLPASQTREQAYAEAARVAAAIQGGGVNPGVAVGGLLGGRILEMGLRLGAAGDLEPVAVAVAAAPVGGWVGPIETSKGWVVARREPYYRFRLSHLVVGHRLSPAALRQEARTEAQAIARAEEALAKLRRDPTAWDRVVAEYSDDTTTRATGGALGDASNVEIPERRPPPEVAAAVASLPAGGISEVTPGRLGVHVVRRDE